MAAHHYMRIDLGGTRISGRAMDADGNEIDKFQLAPGPVIAANGVVNAGDFSPPVEAGSLAVLFGQRY